MSKVVHIGTDMELDPSGSPMTPLFPGAELEVRSSQGLDLTDDGEGKPYPETIIEANRAGLLSLGYRLVAMAHARQDAEELDFHFHLPWEINAEPQACRHEVTVRLVPSKDH